MRTGGPVVALLALATCLPATAEVLPMVAEQAKRDATAIVTADNPPTATRTVLGLALFAALAAGDKHLSAQGQEHLPAWVDKVEPGGRAGTPNVFAVALVAEGILLGDHRSTIGGLTLLEGNLLLGVIVNASKSAFGRARPHSAHSGDWRTGGDSFPSSHAAHAFMIAAVLDATVDRPAWRWMIYPLASGVALARIQEGVHFPTDVVAGGLLGWWIGHRLSVAHDLIERPGKPHLAWVPVKGGGYFAASLSW